MKPTRERFLELADAILEDKSLDEFWDVLNYLQGKM